MTVSFLRRGSARAFSPEMTRLGQDSPGFWTVLVDRPGARGSPRHGVAWGRLALCSGLAPGPTTGPKGVSAPWSGQNQRPLGQVIRDLTPFNDALAVFKSSLCG